MRNVDEVHSEFVQNHINKRTGEREGRLKRGHAHAEEKFAKQVWWPLKGSFDLLHPEFEVMDWRGRSYFADFVYDPDYCKLLIEIKGFQEHVTNMDREKYCRELNRETFLTSLGYRVVSFSYDDVSTRPELCVQLLRMVLSRFEMPGTTRNDSELITYGKTHFLDREIIRYSLLLARPIRPIDITEHLQINYRTAVTHLQRLCQFGWLSPILSNNSKRITRYELTRTGLNYINL